MDGWMGEERRGGRKEGKEVPTKVGIVRTVEVDVVYKQEVESGQGGMVRQGE